MEKEFIPYELALEMKSIGFDEPCMGAKDMNNGEGLIELPLYQQAFRWFREKYCLVCIVFNNDGDIEYENIRYNWEIRVVTRSFKDMKNEKNACLGNYTYKTYEEAQLKCLKKLIKICGTQLK